MKVQYAQTREKFLPIKLPLKAALSALTVFLAAGLTACSLDTKDERVLAELTKISAESAELQNTVTQNTVTQVSCWAPSKNMLDKKTFKVICRVFYVENENPKREDIKRYKDMICVGDTTLNPVAEYCYPWAYYTHMPKFEDQKGFTVKVNAT